MCISMKCDLDEEEMGRIWERLIKQFGVTESPPSCVHWKDVRVGEFVCCVWTGRPFFPKTNLLCAGPEDPTPSNGLVPCDKITELLDSPLGFEEALQLYLYSNAIRSM